MQQISRNETIGMYISLQGLEGEITSSADGRLVAFFDLLEKTKVPAEQRQRMGAAISQVISPGQEKS